MENVVNIFQAQKVMESEQLPGLLVQEATIRSKIPEPREKGCFTNGKHSFELRSAVQIKQNIFTFD